MEHWIAVSQGPSERFLRAVAALARAEPVVLLDLSGRHAQGFVVVAARTISAATVTDMLVHARGTPWLVLPEERCVGLGLAPLGGSPRPAALRFYTSIEARADVTTGVSTRSLANVKS